VRVHRSCTARCVQAADCNNLYLRQHVWLHVLQSDQYLRISVAPWLQCWWTFAAHLRLQSPPASLGIAGSWAPTLCTTGAMPPRCPSSTASSPLTWCSMWWEVSAAQTKACRQHCCSSAGFQAHRHRHRMQCGKPCMSGNSLRCMQCTHMQVQDGCMRHCVHGLTRRHPTPRTSCRERH